MATIDLKSLVGKLNPTSHGALDAAAGLCLARTNYNVELEHLLLKLIDPPATDVAAILRHFDIDVSQLARDLTAALDRLKTGNSRAPALSPQVVTLIREAWMLASVNYQSAQVRTGHLLCALVSDDALAAVAAAASPLLDRISAESLRKNLATIVADSTEQREASARLAEAPAAAPRTGKGGALDQFTIDVTARARAGGIDPVLCREHEIRQIIDILTRRRQNNPILTGEAGVGKTAVVEGFALRIVAEDVPPALRNVELRTLDLGLLQAGAGVKGEFENRLKSVIEEVKSSPRPIVLFIDEAHTLIGAGGAAGQGDAANLLKPALARGELRTIAATTWAEYKKYFERDAALARRFQVVRVEEPEEEAATRMMRGITETLEKHHGVRILDEAVVESVRLSHRYLTGRQLPDKSLSLLDTAAARVAISHAATPPAVDDVRRRAQQLQAEISILQRESITGADHTARLLELQQQEADAQATLAQLDARWKREADLIEKLRHIRETLENDARQTAAGNGSVKAAPADNRPPSIAAGTGAEPWNPAASAQSAVALATETSLSDEQRAELREQWDALNAQLVEVQGEQPLIQPCVNGQAVADVLSDWTGIPVGKMLSDEIRTVLSLRELMQQRIVGQDHALGAIAEAIHMARAGLTDPRRPIGVFLLVGTSGTGKTETAMTLADLLYGGDQNMTVINMSEFKEEHKVSLLMGSPPGYVGYGEGGVLTEAVRRRPYSVVLLDEMEKAHPGVQDIFYQVFDKGTLRDGEGRDIDFKNTIILMTSNAGTDLIMNLCGDPETRPSAEGLMEALHPELLKTFKPAFLGRLKVVPYFPLADDVLRKIVVLQLQRIRNRVRESYGATFDYDPEIVANVAQRCTEVDTGARNIDHILTRTLLPDLSSAFLARMAEGQSIEHVHVALGEHDTFSYEIR